MRKIFILLAFLTIARAQLEQNIRSGFLNLPVDHFSTTDRRAFDIRYLINDQHYREDGPIFIYISGSTAYADFITEGNIFEVAQREGGVLIALEHRYFGQSRPTDDVSFENLRWLTVHQAVADIGRFANFMRQRYNDAPLILFGRDYGGNLAVWARQKYPNVIDGAFASSAPLNAILEHREYFPNVYQTIVQIGGPECGQVIADAFRMIEEAFDAGNTSLIEQRLRLCNPIDISNSYDIARVTHTIAHDIGANAVGNARYPDIDEKCIIMRGLDRPGEPPIDALDAFARWYIDEFHRDTECLMVSNDQFVRDFIPTDWENEITRSGRRQRLWLQCTQLGQFGTSNGGVGHPFGTRFEVRFFEQWCADAFQNDM